MMKDIIRLRRIRRSKRMKYSISRKMIKFNNNKFRVIVRRTCKHFYASMLDKVGNVVAYVSTIKLPGKKMDKINDIANKFAKSIKEFNSSIKYSDLIYDTFYYSFSGNVSKFINTLNELIKD